MQLLYTTTLLLFTLVFYKCQSDSSTDITELNSASSTAVEAATEQGVTVPSGIVTGLTNIVDPTSDVTGPSVPDSNVTDGNSANSTANNVTIVTGISTTTSAPPTASVSTTTSQLPITTTTTLGSSASLIPGFSLGLGIPALLAVVIGTVYY